MRSRYLFILVLVIFLGCKQEAGIQMRTAESLLDSRPDSALTLLSAIRSSTLNTQKEKAYYALLMSAALDKNYIDVQSDSLINIAVDYYSKTRSVRNRMLAWYYQGIVLENAQEYIPSLLSFEKAEQEALTIKEYLYLGLIYRNRAALYSFTNNNPSAIECQEKAINYFDTAGASVYKIYAEASLATIYANNKEYKAADSLINSILQRTDRQQLQAQCRIRQASILVKQDTLPHMAIRLFRSSPKTLYGTFDYGYYALAFEKVGQRDSADYWFAQGYTHCQDQADSAVIDYLKSKVELKRGNINAAFSLIDHATTVQDSVTRVLLQQSLSAAQRDYYKKEAQLREERIRRLRERAGWGLALGVLTLLLTITIALLRARKRDRLLQEQMALLALEERNLERVKSENAHLVGSLFNEKIGRLEELNDLYFKEEDEKQKERIFRHIRQTAASMRKDPTLFPSLEKDLDRYCNGIMTKLREQVPSIKGETNLHTIMLFFAGFSYPVVQFILNKVSIESLKTARSRFRKEIVFAEAEDAELFLKRLEIKKRPQAGTNEIKC